MSWDFKGRSRSDAGSTSSALSTSNSFALVERRSRKFTLKRFTSEPGENIVGPLGLNLLHLAPEPLADIVFVHGLRGGSYKTWRKDNDASTFWPQYWLPLEPELRNVNIHTFGYNSDWGETKDSILNVHDFGRALLAGMKSSPYIRNGGTNQIILVCHSMGGLVAKKAYLLARQDTTDSEFAQRIRCIFFLATPHRGSDSASLLNAILGASGAFSKRQYVTDIEKNSLQTQTINDEFRNFADDLLLYSFYETLKTDLGYKKAIIVEKDSAVLGYKGERVQYLNADHRHVCKYDNPQNENYISVKNALETAVEELLRSGRSSQGEKSKAEIKVLQAYLEVYEPPDEDLDVKLEGTCEWIDLREDFQKWRDLVDESLFSKAIANEPSEAPRRCYWVAGKPGTGKSVLTTHVVNHLNELNLDQSYYFFHHGIKSKRNISALLKSLAYQMALNNSAIRQSLLEMVEDGVNLQNQDERSLWRKLFQNGIFRSKIVRPQYWVIDALDECSGYSGLFPLLAKVPDDFPLRIFITSRMNADMETHFKRHISKDVIESSITPEDTCHDIALYVNARVPELPLDSEQAREELGTRIIRKAQGCFLWAMLVLKSLSNIYDQATIERVLDEMPEEMGDLYQHTVENMSDNIQEKALAKAILRWSVMSIRPLKEAELQEALTRDIGAKVLNIKRSVEGLCGQLLYIDKGGSIQMVHKTAKDFLVGNTETEFGIDVGRTHEKLALECLKYLCGKEMAPPRNRRLLGKRPTQPSAFCDYACTAFSEHVTAASSERDDTLIELDRFLNTNVFTWIEHIARKGDLYHLTRTAKNFKAYLVRRAKYRSPLGGQVSNIEAWATDLIRLVAKFGTALINDPSSIYFLIPPLCPTDSAIYKALIRSADALQLAGMKNIEWEDCISCIDFHAKSSASALACGDKCFAVGFRSGRITIFRQTSFEEERTFQHGQPVKKIVFDGDCRRFVSASFKTICLWSRSSGSLLWRQKLISPCIEISLNSEYVIGMLRSSHLVKWNITDGSEAESLLYHLRQENEHGEMRTYERSPLSASFSPDMELLALGFRGQYVFIFDVGAHELLGSCFRPGENGAATTGLSVGSVLFNPNPDLTLLAVVYQDGDLTIYDYWSLELLNCVAANASSIASSPDGHTLATGNRSGTVQLWSFETLTLLYRIQSDDFDVRALAFSGDSLRLVDIRESRSKIWEPAVLVRKTFDEDSSVSEGVTMPVVTVGSDQGDDIPTIDAIVAHPTLPLIFVGRSDGVVAVHSALTGMCVNELYSTPTKASITGVACTKDNLIASACSGGRIQVWRIENDTKTGSWTAGTIVLDTKHTDVYDTLILSPNGDYLLISSEERAIVMDIRKVRGEDRKIDLHYQKDALRKWVSTTDSRGELLYLAGNQLEQHNWATFFTERRPSSLLAYDLTLIGERTDIHTAAFDAKSSKLIFDLCKSRGNNATAQLLIFDFSPSNEGSEIIPSSSIFDALTRKVKYYIGVANSRLIFIDKESWLSSVSLISQDGKQYTRHFYVPHDMIAENAGVKAVLTSTGDVAFARQALGEVAVVKNGLKFERVVST